MRWLLYHISGVPERLYPEFSFAWGTKTWLLSLGILIAILFLFFFWRDIKNFGIRRKRKILLSLAFVIALTIVFLSGLPEINFYKIKLRDIHGVFLLDDSMSMRLPVDGFSREEWVKRFLEDNFDKLKDINQFLTLEFYSWGDGLKKIGEVKRETLNKQKLKGILDKITATSPESNLKEAICSLKSKEKIGWVVVLSDGVINEPVAAKMPLYEVYPPPSHIKDISIVYIDSPLFAYVRNPVNIGVKIVSSYSKVQEIPVEIFEDGKFMKSKMLNIIPGEKKYSIELRPNFTGEHIYTVKVSVNDTIKENNSFSFILRVLLDRIRVLQVVGRPTWDSRFLRLYLKNDPRIDLISFTILRSNSDNPMSSEDELSLIPFPSNMLFSSELNNFDVVILQNFNYRDYFFFNAYDLLDNLKKFVTKRGGGLVLVGGDLSFSEGEYGGTPVDSIMPVFIPESKGEIYTGKVKLSLTKMGSVNPITSLGMKPDEAYELWEKVPPLDGENLVSGLRSGGIPLLVDKSNGNVVIAVRNVGRGRTLSIATDALWEMAFRSDDEEVRRGYFQFWKRAIRWLIRDENFRQIQIKIKPPITFPKKMVTVKIKAFQNDFTPFSKKELKTFLLKNNKVVRELSLSGQNGSYFSEVTFTNPGSFNLEVEALKNGQVVAENSARIIVRDPYAEELRVIKIEKNNIKGKEITSLREDLLLHKVVFSPKSKMVIGRREVPLYSNLYFLIALSAIFLVYWIIRRKSGLL